ncbi:alpha-amylase family protein [Nocardiopsis sediminis]|uniref:Alpha-amylase n=1 Tax=Nocardiopsis sediminis TaxID=1778267 RepID=A0ABV8FRP9_9ACTN
MKIRRLAPATAALAMAAGALFALTAPAPAQSAPAAPVPADDAPAAAEANGNAIVHLFQWRWESVAQECEDFLGPNGFGAVQVSPPQEHVVLSAQGFPWWQDYQPVSYKIDNTRRGTAADFQDMVDRCRDSGVKIYVDAILNHMSGSGSVGAGPGSDGTEYGKYEYPDLYGDGTHGYSRQDFNACGRDISNWNDRWEVQNCELVGLSDLATGNDYVRDRLAQYLNGLIDMGVAGFRYDAAKHMPLADVEAVNSRLRTTVPGWDQPPYIFQEVIGDGTIGAGEYTGAGDVTEFEYHRRVSARFAEANLQGLRTIGDGLINGDDAIAFVVNHDTQRSDPTLTHRTDRDRYDLAQAFMLAYDYGTAQVMSSYDWTGSNDTGPPSESDGTTRATVCGQDGWVCEHRALNGMATFANATDGTGVDWKDGDGNARIAFDRGTAGFAAFNATDSEWSATVDTALPDGEYCDVANGTFTGGACDSPNRYTVSGGSLTVQVPPEGAVALHVNAPGS